MIFCVLKGSGRAFCSGADAVSLYQLVNEGNSVNFLGLQFYAVQACLQSIFLSLVLNVKYLHGIVCFFFKCFDTVQGMLRNVKTFSKHCISLYISKEPT